MKNPKKLFTIHHFLFPISYFPFPATNGQALVENVLLLPILCIVIMLIAWFSQLLITQQQLITAARYGTDMIAYTNMNAGQIREEIKNYLSDENIEGRRLDPEKLGGNQIRVDINRAPKLTYVPPNYPQVMRLANSSVEVFYEFKVPTIFSAWGSYISGGRLLERIHVSGRSEVLAGTGCKGDNH